MPQNLPEQILQRIVRLSADGNSQREVARMLGVSQGCINKILGRNRDTGRPHQRKRGGSMKISKPREDHQLHRMVRKNRFMIRRFGRRMAVRTIRRRLLAAGYWSRRPARCPRVTLEHTRCRREWGRRHRVWVLCRILSTIPDAPAKSISIHTRESVCFGLFPNFNVNQQHSPSLVPCL